MRIKNKKKWKYKNKKRCGMNKIGIRIPNEENEWIKKEIRKEGRAKWMKEQEKEKNVVIK